MRDTLIKHGARLNKKCLTSIGIPIMNIRRSHDRLIFKMGIIIPVKTAFILRRGPGDANVRHQSERQCNHGFG